MFDHWIKGKNVVPREKEKSCTQLWRRNSQASQATPRVESDSWCRKATGLWAGKMPGSLSLLEFTGGNANQREHKHPSSVARSTSGQSEPSRGPKAIRGARNWDVGLTVGIAWPPQGCWGTESRCWISWGLESQDRRSPSLSAMATLFCLLYLFATIPSFLCLVIFHVAPK